MSNKSINYIETERLILRQFRILDYRQAYKNYLSDNLTTKFLSFNAYTSLFKSFLWCAKVRKDSLTWCIVIKETNELIGSISSRKQPGILEKGDCIGKSVYDLGYLIGSKWWGKGYMPEAANAIIGFLFNKINADSIIAMHNIENPNSGKVMQKIGMKLLKNVFRPYCKDQKMIVENSLYIINKEQYKCNELKKKDEV